MYYNINTNILQNLIQVQNRLKWGESMAKDDLIVTPKPLKGEDGYKIFSIRIKEETVARLEAIAAQTNRSRNELIGIFLEYALDHCIVPEQE